MESSLEAWLEETSFRNCVHFYRTELLKILEGEKIKNLLSASERKSMKRYGITGGRKTEHTLTDRTLEILKNSEADCKY